MSKNKSSKNVQQPIELPTDTFILSLNKKYAKVETNANNELLYTLKNPIKLNKGDQVSLYKSYLNIRGLNSNTITLEKDFDVSIRSGFFIPASIKKSANTGNDAYDFSKWQEYYQVPDPNGLFIPADGGYKLNEARCRPVLNDGNKYSFAVDGDFNSPYIGVQVRPLNSGLGENFYKPVAIESQFSLKAGQYLSLIHI